MARIITNVGVVWFGFGFFQDSPIMIEAISVQATTTSE